MAEHTNAHGPLDMQHSTKRQFKWYNVFMILFMAFGSIEYGYSASIIATTLVQPSFISYFELDTRDNAATLVGLMNSLYQVGGFFGVWTVSYVSDRWGRKMAIIMCALINLLASAGLTGSTSMGMFLAFRFIAGWGGWAIVTAIPIWMNEVAPPKIRGILLDCHNVGFLLGYNLATYAGYGFYHLPADDNWAWRGGMLIQSLWVIILLSGIHWVPESPRWLMMHDRYEEAEVVLNKLHMPDEARVEAIQIRQSIEFDRHHVSSWWSMVAKKSYRKRTLFAMGMALSIQTSGILVVNNYGPTIYASLGFDTNQQLLYQVGWNVIALGTGFMSFFLIDRFARNRLLAFGVGGCASCLVVVCALVGKYTSPEALKNPNKSALHAVIAFIYLFNCFYQLGLGKSDPQIVPYDQRWHKPLTHQQTDGVQFCSLGEIFPNHIRAKGVVVGVATICTINIVWLQVAPIAFKSIGWKFYMVFFIPGFIATAWLWFFFPNTLGIPLEEVAKIFGDANELYPPDTGVGNEDKLSEDGHGLGGEKQVELSHVEEKV